jgi:putative membrane protein
MHAKFILIVLLYAYHHYCGMLVKRFAADKNARDHVFYRFFNEIPVIILTVVVILVTVKPF